MEWVDCRICKHSKIVCHTKSNFFPKMFEPIHYKLWPVVYKSSYYLIFYWHWVLLTFFILLIVGIKRYLVLICRSLVTFCKIYLPSVLLLLLWNVYNCRSIFYWIVFSLNFWISLYILKSDYLCIICVANILVACLFKMLLFFFKMNRSSQF